MFKFSFKDECFKGIEKISENKWYNVCTPIYVHIVLLSSIDRIGHSAPYLRC